MSSFVVIGTSNNDSAARQAVFREIVEGSVANAHYLGVDALFRGSRLLYNAVTHRKLQKFTGKFALLDSLRKRVTALLCEGKRSVNLRLLSSYLTDPESNYLIFCPGTRIDRVSEAVLRTLREAHPDWHLVFYLVDSIDRTAYMNNIEISVVLDYLRKFDHVYTYDRADAETYGDVARFIEIPLWRSAEPIPATPEYDLYFCGHDKRRRDLLLSIYNRLERSGLRPRYRIATWVKENYPLLGATLSEWTPYDVSISELLTANCNLEVLAIHNRESTLRYKEAVMYNKKFLTTNQAIVDLPYYDPRWMRVIQSAEDIDLDWVHAVEAVDYGYRGDYSAETFLKRVEALTENPKT